MSNNTVNPWLGLRSYQEGETIYGRTEEIESLSQCILANIQTVLYGKSGIGKTSLLNAGVFPNVRKKGVFPVNLRLEHNSESYCTQISRAVFCALKQLRKESLDETGDKVVFIEEGSFIERVKPILDGHETLWEFFHRYEFFDEKGKKIVPMLVFDQFEEIFTLERDSLKVRSFFSELADLLNGVVPDYICNAIDDYATKDVSSDVLDNGLSFVFSDFNVESDHYEDYLTQSDFHLVFSIREDFLSYLERETVKIPSLRQNRYCLQAINEEQAAIIIMNPIPGLVSDNVAKLIISKVLGDDRFELDGVPERQVDSAILSLYLSRLYDRIPENESEISSSLVESEAESIVASFYTDAIADIPSTTIEYLEDSLVNGEGRRESISVYKAKSEGNLTDGLLKLLIEDKKLLRQFDYGGGLRIEFIHDILCPLVAKRKDYRKAIKEQQEIEIRNQKEAERLEKEKLLVREAKAKNRKRTILLLVSAVGLAIIAFLISLISISNIKKERELKAMNREVHKILPLVIEQKINDGDSFSASALLSKMYPDALYIKEDPTNTTLLRQLSCNNALSLYGHSRAVNAAKFTKDGKYVITGSDDASLCVWNAQNGHLEHSLNADDAVSSIALGPDDRTIVFSTKSGRIEVVSLGRNPITPLLTANLSDTYARFITFNPDGTELIACCTNGDLQVYNAKDLSLKQTIKTANKGITSIIYDPTGRKMILGGSDKTITIRDAERKSLIASMPGHTDWVRSVAISPNGNLLASCSDDNSVRLWDLNAHKSIIVQVLPYWGTMVRFTPDGNRLIVSSKDGVLRTIDVRTLTELTALQIKHSGPISSFDLSPDGNRVVTCTSTPIVHIWDCGEPMDTGIDIRLKGAIYGLSLIKGTELFAAASNAGQLGVWNITTGDNLFLREIGTGDHGRVSSLSTSPDGRFIAVSTKFQVRLFEASNGDEIDFDNTNGHRGWVRDLRFSNNGQLLVSVGNDKKIIIWSIPERKVIKRIDAHSDGIYSVCLSHNDSVIVTGSVDSTICQWKMVSGDLVDRMKDDDGHKGTILKVCYSQDDSKILSTSSDQTACLWNSSDGTVIQKFVGASGFMSDACFLPTEQEIVTASADKGIRIWALDGRESVRLDGHLGGVSRLAIASDGTLISGDNLGEIKIWRIPSLKSVADSIQSRLKGISMDEIAIY